MVYKFTVSVFESENDWNLLSDFQERLKSIIKNNILRNNKQETKHTFYILCGKDLIVLVPFSILFNGLEPFKPLILKRHKRNQDVFPRTYILEYIP